MSDNKVMLDLDSPILREMMAKRTYEHFVRLRKHPIPWEETSKAWKGATYDRVDATLAALRGLAADGLLVRG